MGHNQQPGAQDDLQRFLSGLAGQQQLQQQQLQQQQQQPQLQPGMAYPGQQQPLGVAGTVKRKPDGVPDTYDPKRQHLQHPLAAQQLQQQPRAPGAPPGPPAGQQAPPRPLAPGPPQTQQQQQQGAQHLGAQQQHARLLGAAAATQAAQRPPQPGMPGVLLGSAALLAMRPPQLPGAGAVPGPVVGSPGAAALTGPLPPGSEVFNAPVVVAEQVVATRLPVARRLVPDGRGGFTNAPALPDEQGRILPRSQLDRLMRMQGLDQTFKLAPDVQAELARLAEDFVADLVERGCQLAALRRTGTLRASDLAPYLERTHHIRVPGFGGELRPYRRPSASELHRERAAAVRQSAAMGGGGGGGGGAPGGVGGGAGGMLQRGRGG